MDAPDRIPEPLIRDNLYNWLGYGNLNGRYWFIGREEFDSLERCRNLDSLREYYEVRKDFDYAEDFVNVWEEVYGRSVRKGAKSTTTRHYQAAFLLSFAGTSPKGRNPRTGRSRTASFVFDEMKFGREDGNHFSGEVYPLRYHPEQADTFEPYRHLWDNPDEYNREVLPRRVGLFEEQLRANPDVKIVISYAGADTFVKPLKNRLECEYVGTRPANKRNEFELTRCFLDQGRSILLVDSPFLGQGHVGYSEIEALTQELDTLVENS